MGLKKIIRIKEGIKEVRSKELREIDMQIEATKKDLKLLESQAEHINEQVKVSFSEGLLFQYRSLISRRKELLKKLYELELLKERKREKLKEVYRDIKSLDILRTNMEKENLARAFNLDFQRSSFMYLVKRRSGSV